MKRMGIPSGELEMLKSLNRGNVAYLLIGGYAMRWYGASRPTADVDLLAAPTLDNARRFVRVVERALGHAPGFSAHMFAEAKRRVNFRGDGYRVSILTSVDDLAFEAAYQERTHASQDRVFIPVVSRRHLVLIKRVAASVDPGRRDKELSDIAFLESQAPHNFGIQTTAFDRG